MGVISLGPFDLAAPIGRGGMGEVWSGVHRAQQVPVVVKVLTTETARDPRFRQSFRHEVRAVAALDHPGIIVVYDHGVIPAEVRRRASRQVQRDDLVSAGQRSPTGLRLLAHGERHERTKQRRRAHAVLQRRSQGHFIGL